MPTDPTEPKPRPDAGVTALRFLALLGCVAALWLAKAVVVPVVIACLLALLLLPVVRGLERWRIPPTLTATVLIVLGIGASGFAVVSLLPPAQKWIEQMPAATRKVERFVIDLRRPVENVGKVGEQLESLTNGGDSRRTVELRQPGFVERALWGTVDVVWAAALVLFLLFFLLGTRVRLLHNLGSFVVDRAQGGDASALVEATGAHVSRYLLTIALINAGLGVAVGAGLAAVGLPNPVLWGVMAALLNFVPYLGGVVGVSIVALVGVMTFDTPSAVLAGPAVYLGLNTLEGMIVTPLILGQRFRLDPGACLIWLILWGWLWGIPGTLLAIPMLTVAKIAADHIEALRPLSRIVGAEGERQAGRPPPRFSARGA